MIVSATDIAREFWECGATERTQFLNKLASMQRPCTDFLDMALLGEHTKDMLREIATDWCTGEQTADESSDNIEFKFSE